MHVSHRKGLFINQLIITVHLQAASFHYQYPNNTLHKSTHDVLKSEVDQVKPPQIQLISDSEQLTKHHNKVLITSL